MSTIANIIAIDGPAGSGKSTIGKLLADRLGYLFFDTGVMYRAVTLAALQRGIPVEAEQAIVDLAERVHIDVYPASREDGRVADVFLDGKDVTWEIRSPEVEAVVSVVSAYGGVRTAMVGQQRRVGLRGRVVMTGRDIGTVVLPEAGLKVYLDASVEERAHRRYVELAARGECTDYAQVFESMRMRDRIDSTRSISPLKPADGAICMNTDGLSVEQVIDRIIRIVEQ